MSTVPPSSDPWSGGGPPGYIPPPPGSFAYASWGQRVGASLLDALIGSSLVILGFLVGSYGLVALGYVGSFAFGIWNSGIQQGNTGQTIGKKALGIRLQRMDGVSPPGVGLAIGRYFVHVVDALPCGIGYLWPLWDEKRQTFADKILNTVVIAA